MKRKHKVYRIEAYRKENGWVVVFHFFGESERTFIAKDLAKFVLKKLNNYE